MSANADERSSANDALGDEAEPVFRLSEPGKAAELGRFVRSHREGGPRVPDPHCSSLPHARYLSQLFWGTQNPNKNARSPKLIVRAARDKSRLTRSSCDATIVIPVSFQRETRRLRQAGTAGYFWHTACPYVRGLRQLFAWLRVCDYGPKSARSASYAEANRTEGI